MKLQIQRVGDSTALLLPDELLAKLGLEQGQWLGMSELPGGGVRLPPCDASFQKAMAIVDKVMVEYHGAPKKLADE